MADDLTGEAARAARFLLKWSVQELCERTGLNKATIARIERGKPAQRSTLMTLRRIFEDAGVTFEVNDESPSRTTVLLREGTTVVAPTENDTETA